MACCRWRHDQSPFGGEAVGPNPTDRAKGGTKRSILVDGNGIPVSVVVDGANRHDKKLLEATIEQLQAPQPDDEEIHLGEFGGGIRGQDRMALRFRGWL